MSRVLFELNELVRACYPKDQAEALELWHAIKPVRFGSELAWTIATDYQLAFYAIPDDGGYLVVTRVDSYVATPIVTAAGYGLMAPIAALTGAAVARWAAAPNLPFPPPNQFNVTGVEELHKLTDTDEFLFFKGGNQIALQANLPVNPTADTRLFVTTVYAYLLGPSVADKLGSGESLIQAT